MNRNILIAMGLAAALTLAACGKKEDAAPVEAAPAPVAEQPAMDAAPAAEQVAADAAVAAQSCAQDCGEGVTATIQCAAGETAVCECGAEPNAKCEPAAAMEDAAAMDSSETISDAPAEGEAVQ